MANTSIRNAFERMWQHTVALLNKKADLVDGKIPKEQLPEDIDFGGGSGNSDGDFLWKVRENGHYSLMLREEDE